jgi:hypothetical protein
VGINYPTVCQDVNFVENSNGFHPSQGFNSGWNKSNFLFDNRQQSSNRQNFKNNPSLRDIVRDQLRINAEFGKKKSCQ